MATTSELLTSLQQDKANLVEKLNEKGVEASDSETFTELIPKMDDIQSGGDISEYFNSNVTGLTNSNTTGGWTMLVKNLPPLNFNGTTLTNMFANYRGHSLNLSNFNTSNTTAMDSMLNNCQNLTTIEGIENFDTSKVTTMQNMFSNCKKLTTLNLSNFDASKVKHTQNVLLVCNELIDLNFMSNVGQGFTQKTNNYYAYEIDLHLSTNLTHDSLMTVINKLYDLNLTYDVANDGVLYTQKLTLGSTNTAKLTAAEIAIATNKGWTVS